MTLEEDEDDEKCDEPTEEDIIKWKAERKLEKARRVSRKLTLQFTFERVKIDKVVKSLVFFSQNFHIQLTFPSYTNV